MRDDESFCSFSSFQNMDIFIKVPDPNSNLTVDAKKLGLPSLHDKLGGKSGFSPRGRTPDGRGTFN